MDTTKLLMKAVGFGIKYLVENHKKNKSTNKNNDSNRSNKAKGSKWDGY